MQDSAINLIAKLLANENINVVRDAVRTAAFDIINRTLILPQWKDITPAVDQMLIAHEVSHALFTSDVYVKALKTDLMFDNAASYLNILEDVRVERLMKIRYPGLRKVFAAGYKELNDKDFFEIQGRDLTDAHLMDRININFKVGYGIASFSEEEAVFVDRAQKLETVEQTVELARDIFNFLQQKKIQENQTEQNEDSFDTAEDDNCEDQVEQNSTEQYQEESEESINTMSHTHPNPGSDVDVEAPTTNQSFEDKVTQLVDLNTRFKYWVIEPPEFDPIIPYKEILQKINQFNVKYNGHLTEREQTRVRKFKHDTQNNVDFLIKEFEMKKAAENFKRSQVSKTGSLDMNKVWSYKLKDDIFKRVTKTQQGKNHGMVFLLDWSSSMQRMMNNTIEQLINLVVFCQRSGIKFQVLAFTDRHISESSKDYFDHRPYFKESVNRKNNLNDICSINKFGLLELFSSEMNQMELNTMVSYLLTGKVVHFYSLFGTPLNESLMFMYHHLERFQKKYSIEKLSFITLTDGEGNALSANLLPTVYIEEAGRRYRINVKHFVHDQFTKKDFNILSNSSQQTNTLITMIKQRYKCAVLGFFVTSPSTVHVSNAVRAHWTTGGSAHLVDSLLSSMRSKGYASLPDTGRDELFIVPPMSTQSEDLEIAAEQSAKTVAVQFGKYMSARKSNRVLLSKFIDCVC